MSESICRYRGSKMCKGKGTPGNNTTGRGKSGSSCCPRTLSMASLILIGYAEGLWQRLEQGRKETKSRGQNSTPAFVLGNVSGGHRAHRQMKRVSPTVLVRTP